MYSWPIKEILNKADAPVKKNKAEGIKEALTKAGYGNSVFEFLCQLYEAADGATFFDGAFRVIPLLNDSKKDSLGSIIEWNESNYWKECGSKKTKNVFFFCMNAFGDLIGVPLDEKNEISKDCAGILWVEKSACEESTAGWKEIFSKILSNQDHMADFLARLKEYNWAKKQLGKPKKNQCFSWNLPPVIGGKETIDNLKIVSAKVHVSFTLQVLKQAKERNQ